MAIPDYETLMLPILKFANDGNEHSVREATDLVINGVCTSYRSQNTQG